MTSLNEIISPCTGEEDKVHCATFNYGQDSMLIDESCGFKSDGDIGNNSGKESIITDNSYRLKENAKTEENYEEIVHVNDMDRAVYNDLVSFENLNTTHRKGLPFSFSPNNEVHDLDSKISGLNLGLNNTFDANLGTADEVLAIQKHKTLNLSTCKPENLKFEHLEKLNRLDSEESLGIIPDLLDDNTSLEIFVPFQSHKSSIKLVNKFQDTNCFSFSPLHVTKKMKVSLAEANSPLKRDGRLRFTSTPKQLSAKLTSLLKSSENDQDCGTKGGIEGKEVDVNELKECYEDFKKGNLFTSTSKGSPLQDSLNILETTNTLKVNPTMEREDVSSILLNATFHIQPESMPEVLPQKVLADTLPIPSENISKNKTITIEDINDATKVFEKEGKSSSKDLPGSTEVIKLNLTEIISSHSFSETSAKNPSDHDSYLVKSEMPTTCTTKSKLRKSLSMTLKLDPPIDHDSCLVESKQISCKTKIKLRKSLSMTQKLDPPKSKSNQCSELNSTICLENKKPSSIATNLKKRYSLSAVPTNKTRSSTSGLFKTYPMLKSDKCVDSSVTENKQPSLKTTNSAKSFKNRVSLIKPKSSTRNPSIGSLIKPKVFLPIKNELEEDEVDEKNSLDSTFVKDEGANIKKVLSPINEVHKLTGSQMETLSPSHSERNGTFTLSLESCVDKVNELSKSLSRDETNLAIPTEDDNSTIAAPKKCFEVPMINTKVLKKDEASEKTILVKPKEFAKDKLGTEKNIKNKIKFLDNIKEKELNTSPRISKYSKQLPIKTQNVNLNEKRNFLKATTREQYSSLPTLRSTFSKNAIPEKSRINSKLHIEPKDSKASFSSHSNLNNVKLQKKASVQTARVLRPPEVSLAKENGKMKNSSVPDKTFALCDEIDQTENIDVSQGILKPKVENALPAPKQVGGVKTGSKIPAASRQIPSLRKILPPKTYSR